MSAIRFTTTCRRIAKRLSSKRATLSTKFLKRPSKIKRFLIVIWISDAQKNPALQLARIKCIDRSPTRLSFFKSSSSFTLESKWIRAAFKPSTDISRIAILWTSSNGCAIAKIWAFHASKSHWIAKPSKTYSSRTRTKTNSWLFSHSKWQLIVFSGFCAIMTRPKWRRKAISS